MKKIRTLCDYCKKDIQPFQLVHLVIKEDYGRKTSEFDYCDRFCLAKDFEDEPCEKL